MIEPPRVNWLNRLAPGGWRRGTAGTQADSASAAGEQLDDISAFILGHGLEVTSFTLDVAHQISTDKEGRLASAVKQRTAAQEPVTLEWLQTIASGPGCASKKALDELQERLEHAITRFAQTASDTRNATSQYSNALEQHAEGLHHQSEADAAAQIAGLVHDMLARTRTLETELDRSERETKELEKNLADARRDAEIDYLTGLLNRRAFEAAFEREVELAVEHGEPIYVALCDIDHFKRINDEHGHEAGDRILRNVAQTLSSLLPDTCQLARHGGEEFAVLIRGMTLKQARRLLDDARQTIAERRLINRATDVPFGRVTFSAGMADVRACKQPRDALRMADLALYEAKASGRNRLVVGSSSV